MDFRHFLSKLLMNMLFLVRDAMQINSKEHLKTCAVISYPKQKTVCSLSNLNGDYWIPNIPLREDIDSFSVKEDRKQSRTQALL